MGLQEYYKIITSKVGRCTFPFEDCQRQPINAHSIQNRTSFELLHLNNHVVSVTHRFDASGRPVSGFHLIGRNNASTFAGLCAQHDNLLFTKIDKQPFNCDDKEYMFLLAYRALLRENHASTSTFIKGQQIYSERIKNGLIPGENEAIEVIISEFGIKAYGVQLFKAEIDGELRGGNFDYLKHFVVKVQTSTPTIACSHTFVIDGAESGEAIHLFVNIFPVTSTETVVVFSTLSKHSATAENYLSRCLINDSTYSLYEISKLVLRKCENLFINPAVYNAWTQLKRQKILQLFSRTIREDYDDDSTDYYLF